MSEPLKVLMMGGRRCGKTSALASLFEQMINGDVKNHFTVADRTTLETKGGGERQESLLDKSLELQYMLATNKESSNIFLVDKGPTRNYWLYKLCLQIPGRSQEMYIEFRDSNGEFFEASGLQAEETIGYIRNCDVFVVVIDTPYLMGPVEKATKDICPEAINLGVNRVKDIQNFLTNINDNEGKDAKMVVFVPLKCEKWMHENRINEVVQRVKKVYDTCIQNLMAYEKMNISIIPMETSGNILFSELREAFLYKDELHQYEELYQPDMPGVVRCCKIDDSIIRLENGDNKFLDKNEMQNVIIDSTSIINGINKKRPYSWFHIRLGNNDCAPRNCEQLPLHIIRFMLAKLNDAQNNKKGGLIGWFTDIIKRIMAIFGSIDPNKLLEIIIDMQKKGVIKDSGCGIEILRKF